MSRVLQSRTTEARRHGGEKCCSPYLCGSVVRYGGRISRMSKVATSLLIVVALSAAVLSQQAPPPAADRPAFPATLRQIIPGHYVYAANNDGRLFNSGVVVTSDGALVFDALETEATARAERQAIAGGTAQLIRYLVSSPFHDPFSGGTAVYADVFKIGHENYRAGFNSGVVVTSDGALVFD